MEIIYYEYASYDETNRRIFVSAKETGKENDFSITGADLSGLKALAAAGLSVVSQADKESYAKMATYAKATTQDTSDAMYEMLKNLKAAYDSNAELTLKEKNLNAKINYSNAKDAVNELMMRDKVLEHPELMW